MPHEIEFSDEKLEQAVARFFEHLGPRLNPDWHGMLAAAFKTGWSESLHANLGPALDLCMWFMRFSTLQQKTGENANVVLTPAVLEQIVQRCEAVIGNPDMVALNRNIEAVVVDASDQEPRAPKSDSEGD